MGPLILAWKISPTQPCFRQDVRLNTDLAKKPPEYIVVPSMVHLLEPTYSIRFTILMDQFMRNWRFYREKLNRLPVRHEKCGY
jgi:predicted metal-dependent hydrolase